MDAHLVKGGPGDDVSSDPADLFWLHYDVGYAFHTVLSFFFIIILYMNIYPGFLIEFDCIVDGESKLHFCCLFLIFPGWFSWD